MPRAEKLIIASRFEEALALLSSQKTGDEVERLFCEGYCFTMLGQVEYALEKFKRGDEVEKRRLFESTRCSIYSGIACWYHRRRPKAIAFWKEGIGGTYSTRGGFDTQFLLYFAAASGYDGITSDDAVALLQKRINAIGVRTDDSVTARLLTREIDESQYAEYMHNAVAECRSAESRRFYKMLQTFYTGLRRLADGDRRTWVRSLEEIVSEKIIDDVEQEWMIAKCELRKKRRKSS